MMKTQRHDPRRADAGFTLVELLVAFSILLVGMTGIITMFATGLSLEREATLSFEATTVLEDLRPEVIERMRLEVTGGRQGQGMTLQRRPVEGYPGLQYEVRAIQAPEDPWDRVWLVEIVVLAPTTSGFREFSNGMLPVVLEPTYEERIKEALSKDG